MRKGSRLRKPPRISPAARSTDRLARHYHTVVPLLRDIMGLDAGPDGADDIEAVAVDVDEMVVPAREARRILARAGESSRRLGNTAPPDGKVVDDAESRHHGSAPTPRPERRARK